MKIAGYLLYGEPDPLGSKDADCVFLEKIGSLRRNRAGCAVAMRPRLLRALRGFLGGGGVQLGCDLPGLPLHIWPTESLGTSGTNEHPKLRFRS